MYKVCLVLFLFASVYSESQVRETETWMPMKTSPPAEVTLHDVVGSGDSPNGSDFGFTEDDDDLEGEDDDDDDDSYDDYHDDDEDEDYEDEEMSGSGDEAPTVTIRNDNTKPSSKPNINENKIPELDLARPRPTVNEIDLVRNHNEVPVRAEPPPLHKEHPNVLMAHAGSEGLFNKTEVLAAVIVGAAVTLLCAVLLIVFLIYRMRKKDEGSYDVGKKPIYRKAPTTEIYA